MKLASVNWLGLPLESTELAGGVTPDFSAEGAGRHNVVSVNVKLSAQKSVVVSVAQPVSAAVVVFR